MSLILFLRQRDGKDYVQYFLEFLISFLTVLALSMPIFPKFYLVIRKSRLLGGYFPLIDYQVQYTRRVKGIS